MTTSEALSSPRLLNGEVFGRDKYIAPRLKPESYPGEISPHLYSLQVGNSLHEMQFDPDTGTFAVDTDQGMTPIDEVLASMDLPAIADRLPVTVFGSNRCPGQLLDKFSPREGEEPNPRLTTVIMATGTLKGYDVVYNAKVGNQGYFFADLYQGSETADTEVEVAVIFATPEQLKLIDESEKAYDYSLIGEVEVGRRPSDAEDQTRFKMPAYVHAGKAVVYANEGHPVALAAVAANNRTLSVQSQDEFQTSFFTTGDVVAKRQAFIETSGNPSVEVNGTNYRKYMAMKRAGGLHSLAERKAFQAALIAATTDEERMAIDTSNFETPTKVDFTKDILPAFGQIAVINWLAGRR